ncbi:EF-hand domain-containing protein [Ensifer adhaerens]|uniref:EF-hand domain-containing protein n=1 Tax=Ensifer adhaerens TaxID=106592 RepID=UPI001C4DDF51|nr:EF-hand domain-containing protein [Ensifer adhaerens]MBW0368038.1 EF-hand domain-containing protein [Ensifer adhaerens]UCM23705.1 EF-hand domain-containing protein [Ensifer adhaerens]
MNTTMSAYVAIFGAFLSCGPTPSFAQDSPALKQDEQPGYSEMMPGAMMEGRQHGMMVGRMRQGMMQGHTLKIMFAVADNDGDGALSFEEVTAIHKRIFDKVDANKDGKVTPEEVQGFMRD